MSHGVESVRPVKRLYGVASGKNFGRNPRRLVSDFPRGFDGGFNEVLLHAIRKGKHDAELLGECPPVKK